MSSTLAIMAKVAVHPRVVMLRQKQEAMRNRFVADYGHDFMGAEILNPETRAVDVKETEAFEMANGFEGVNRWTPVERAEYERLTGHLSKIRAELRTRYAESA